jgi:hypothetical protein
MGSKSGSKPKIRQLVVQDVVKSYIGLTMNVLIVNGRWRGKTQEICFLYLIGKYAHVLVGHLFLEPLKMRPLIDYFSLQQLSFHVKNVKSCGVLSYFSKSVERDFQRIA